MPQVNSPTYAKRPSQRQEQVLKFILAFQGKHQYSPSLEEIAEKLDVSIATTSQHISALIKKGFIRKTKNKPRSITVNPNLPGLKKIKPDFLNIPVLGAANAGAALLHAEQYTEGYLRVPRTAISGRADIFAIRVEGDSMNKAKINGKKIEDRDFVLIDPKDMDIKNGDYVISIIEGLGTIKKFHRDKKTGEITLLPESTNPKHKPIYISSKDDFLVNGKIIGVVKK